MPPESDTYYEVLGLPAYASIEEVKAAYYRLAKQYHPDRNPEPEAAVTFDLINEAYKVVGHPTQKAVYDAALRRLPMIGGAVADTGVDMEPGDFARLDILPESAFDHPRARGFWNRWTLGAAGAICIVLIAGLATYFFLPAIMSVRAPQPGQTFSDCYNCPSMTVLPAGIFVMGAQDSEPSAPAWAMPSRTVTIAHPFAIGRFEVMAQEYVDFLNVSYGSFDPRWITTDRTDPNSIVLSRLNKFVVQAGFETHPAVGVSWLGAQAYVRWLSEKTGRKYRLPSEAEWEYAARAGEKGAVYTIETLKDVCRIGNVPDLTRRKAHPNWGAYPCEDGFAEAAPAGRFEPNKFGLYDTLGNAWEWVQDCWHPSYEGAPRDGSAWMTDADCQLRVLRGNSYENFSDFALAARVFTTSLRLSPFNGFRVVRDLSEP